MENDMEESDDDQNDDDDGEEDDDDEEDDNEEENNGNNNDDGDDEDQNDNNQFESESLAVMLTLNYKFSNKVPIFLHAAGGYSFATSKPAYSVMLGYNQVILKGLGIYAGIRYSDSFFDAPEGATNISPSDGIKIELGASLNF